MSSMRSVGNRALACAFLAIGLLLASPLSSGAQGRDIKPFSSDGDHWLIACVAPDDVARFLRMGFELGSAGAPVLVLCGGDDVFMAKALGR